MGFPLALDQGACRIFRVRQGAYLGFCHTDGPTGSAEVMLTLETADVDAACAELEPRGAEITLRPRLNERFRIYQMFIRDPNGYTIEIQRFLDPHWGQV
jgi:catechol 2,3-dioxygenase-like lactoylglutathione lyase family enzyme